MSIIVNTPGITKEFGIAVGNISPKNISFAKRIDPRPLPKPQTQQQKLGLRFEKKVVKALKNQGLDLEHNPWFADDFGIYVPDVIVYTLARNRAIVIEVKLTYTPEATKKLLDVYCPVVSAVTGLKTAPMVIVKNLLRFPDPHVTQWLGYGPIVLA